MEQKIINGDDLKGMQFIELEDGTLKVYKPVRKKFTPNFNQRYWYITHYGRNVGRTYQNSQEDNWIITHNHVFETAEEVEDYKLFLEQLDKYTYKFSKEEWKDFNLKKYYLFFDYNNMKVTIESFYSIKNNNCFFGNIADIVNFIKEAGEERIKNYMFDIWED